MSQGGYRQFDLPSWTERHHEPVAKILQILGLQHYDLLSSGQHLLGLTPEAIAQLTEQGRQKLLGLLEDLHFFEGSILPKSLVPQHILVPGEPFPCAVEILRPLIGYSISCVSNYRPHNPRLDGSQQAIQEAAERFAGSRWHTWIRNTRFPQELNNQYALMALAVMVASSGRYDLQDTFPGYTTCWDEIIPFFTHLSGNPGQAVIYARPGKLGAESADISYWMQLVNSDSLEFNTKGNLVVAASTMAVERVGYDAQRAIQSEWPDCKVYVTAPEIPENDRPNRLLDAVKALGAHLVFRPAPCP
ncbi:MAG TPA: hypothetical protein VFO38_00345 [Candidatus Saccharimonadales bacterium]|nr:hypothetical protein [Candidatus Saccharimonadales bacterium]